MIVRAYVAFVMWFLSIGMAAAQSYANLGSEAQEFAIPSLDTHLRFPQDHGAHPEFRVEWWYVTANLSDAAGNSYGVQWTLFRTAFQPNRTEGWRSPQIWMGHAGLTTASSHFAAERLARDGIGQAGVRADPFLAWIDEWKLAGVDIKNVRMSAQGVDFSYSLQLSSALPLVLQGRNGYSVKSREGQASHYYSQPFYRARGTLTLPEGQVAVTGTAWLDREWSSQPLSAQQSGWDWFALTFDDGARLMGFRLREEDSAPFTAATWIAADGTPTAYPDGAFRAEPLAFTEIAGHRMPTTWRVNLEERGVDATIEALNPKSWMDLSMRYWEGPVSVHGSHDGAGYLEMTGYPTDE